MSRSTSLLLWGAPLLVGRKKADHAHEQRSAFSGVNLWGTALATTAVSQLHPYGDLNLPSPETIAQGAETRLPLDVQAWRGFAQSG